MTTARRWTADEDKRLAWAWDKHGPRELARTFGRSAIAIYHRASRLGLGNGVPRGGETLEEAARRCGVVDGTLKLAMELAGVRARRLRHNPHVGRAHPRRRWLWPEDADRAIAAWCSTETITAAARRLGISRYALNRVLHERGQVIRVGGHLRVLSAHADAARADGRYRRGAIKETRA